MSSENLFLQNIRAALGQQENITRTRESHPQLFPPPKISAPLLTIADRSIAERKDLLEVLRQSAEEINLRVHTVDSDKEAENLIVDLIRSNEPEFSFNKHVILHNHPNLNGLKLWKRFNRESVTVHTSFSEDLEAREKTLASFIGITSPSIAIAESASIVQITSPGCPRSTSLVPSIHIAVIRESDIVANLQEAYALLSHKQPPDSFVFISGPSKTADIEAHMVHGAHGPREMHLLVIAPPEHCQDIDKTDNELYNEVETEENV